MSNNVETCVVVHAAKPIVTRGIMMDMVWIPLESNPDVMNLFLHDIGVPEKVRVVDVYGFDPEMLALVPKPTLALLLLFPCDDKYEEFKSKEEQEIKEKGQTLSSKLYFLKQYVHNACGTIALIHSIANLENVELRDGYLKQFLDDSKNMTPEERGQLLQTYDGIINAHMDVATAGQTAPPDLYDPVPYHFVAFVHKDGSLYELDGRKEFPVNHGKSSEETFLQDAASVCRKYMSRNPENVNFTAVAITGE